MGCLPIELAKIFGPHAEVEGLLGAAMIKATQQQSAQPANALSRKQMAKRLESAALQTARSGDTAITIQYPMWLMPVHEFMTLSELRPHQELVAAGKLVKLNAAMNSVFFLSHQWTSFDRPDHSTSQLRTVQKALVRMLCGKLPTTSPQFTDEIRFPSNVQIGSAEWKEIVGYAHVWIDYISVRSRCMILTRLCISPQVSPCASYRSRKSTRVTQS